MKSQKLNHRQAWWSLELSEFNFSLLHKPGSSMIIADSLSRLPNYERGSGDNDSITLLHPEHIRHTSSEYASSSLVEDIHIHSDSSKQLFDRHSSSPGWSFANGLACWFNRIAVPYIPSLCERVLRESQDSIFAGHPGCSKTLELVLHDFWWPSVTKDCHKCVDGCPTCQRSKPLHQKPFSLLSPNKTRRIIGRSSPAILSPIYHPWKVTTP